MSRILYRIRGSTNLSRCFWFPDVKTGYLRYILSGLLSINFFLLYAERLTLSVAITAMVNSTKTENTTISTAVCQDPHFVVKSTVDEDVPEAVCFYRMLPIVTHFSHTKNTKASSWATLLLQKGEFEWDQSQQGMITYAFFVGYLFSQIPGGYLAQTYSVKWVIGAGVGLTSIMTCLTSLAARYHLSAFLALRFIEGLGEVSVRFCVRVNMKSYRVLEAAFDRAGGLTGGFSLQGVISPSIFVYVTKWIPTQEQGFLLNLMVSGATLGTVLTMPFSAMLCNSALGWPAAFYIFGEFHASAKESRRVHPV